MYCTATNRQGKPCRAQAIAGAVVCRLHGGSAPQVRAKANLRLLALSDPAITALTQLVNNKRLTGVRLGAAKDILDRAGIGEAPPEAGNTGATIQLVVMQAGVPRVQGQKAFDITSLIKR